MNEKKYAEDVGESVSKNKPQSLTYPNIPDAVLPPPRKDRTITFRVTNKMHGDLEKWAEYHDVSMSGLVAVIVEEYWKAQKGIYEKAQYFNACSEETRAEILRHEKNYPKPYRQFSIAKQLYPSAGVGE